MKKTSLYFVLIFFVAFLFGNAQETVAEPVAETPTEVASEFELLVQYLEEKDLVFSLAHHRFLWPQIHQLTSNVSSGNDNYLLMTLQENMISYPEYNSALNDIFNVQEHDRPIISEPDTDIKSAIACLEAVSIEKYKQYCEQKINKLNQQKDITEMNYYCQEIINTKIQLEQLALLRMY